MGVVADAALAGGAEVIGVIPRRLVEREVAHRCPSDLRVVETMHERKALMNELADSFVRPEVLQRVGRVRRPEDVLAALGHG